MEGMLLLAAVFSLGKGPAPIILFGIAAVLSIPLLYAVYHEYVGRRGKKRGTAPELAARTPLTQFFIQGTKRAGAVYEQIAEYKAVKRQLSSPWSFANASKRMRIVRFCAAGACVLSGAFLILTLFGIPFPAVSAAFAVLAAAALFLFGVCSLGIGFLRSLGVVAAAAAAAAFVFFVYTLLKYSLPRSLWVSAIVVFLSFWSMTGAGYAFLRYRRRKTATALFVFPFGDGWKGTDLDFKELLPVHGYAQFVRVVCGWEGSPESLLRLIGAVQRFAVKKEAVFCGFELGGDGNISLFFYDRVRWGTDMPVYAALVKTLRKENAAVLAVHSENDAEWEQYQTALYPDHQTLLDTEAENMDAMLEKAGLDFSMPLRFGFTLLFAEKADSLSFSEAVKETGYRVDQIEDHTDEVVRNGLERKFSYSVNISRRNRASGEHLKLLTADVRKTVERFHGELLEWGLVDTFLTGGPEEKPGVRGTRS